MTQKREFSNDWSHLNSNEIIENVKYLTKNLRKYKITKISDRQVNIDNIKLSYNVERWTDSDGEKNSVSVMTINNRRIPISEAGYEEAFGLLNKCDQQLKTFKEKASEWWNLYGGVERVTTAGLAVIFGLGVMFSAKAARQKYQAEKQQFKQEVVQEALDSLRKEQQKTAINFNQNVR